MVYSFLVYRLSMAKGSQAQGAVTRQQIHRGTGLSDTRTIPAALTELEQHGLVGFNEGRVFPFQPRDRSWFVEFKNPGGREWYARITYFPIWIPDSAKASGLVPRVNALYFLIAKRPAQRQKYYALKLRVSVGTIRSAVSKLRRLGLISPDDLKANDPEDGQRAYWQDRQVRKAKQWRLSSSKLFKAILCHLDGQFQYFSTIDAEGRIASQVCTDMIDWFGQDMRTAGYSTKEIDDYWRQVIELCHLDASFSGPGKFELFVSLNFPVIFEYVEQQTLKARAAGQFSGTNSLGLLLRVTRQAIGEIDQAWDNFGTFGLGRCTYQWQPKSHG